VLRSATIRLPSGVGASPTPVIASPALPRATGPATAMGAPGAPTATLSAATGALPTPTGSAQGAGPAVGTASFSSAWNPATTYPVPPRVGAVPGWPLSPQPPLPIQRRSAAELEAEQ
jgi:hypothetical protein